MGSGHPRLGIFASAAHAEPIISYYRSSSDLLAANPALVIVALEEFNDTVLDGRVIVSPTTGSGLAVFDLPVNHYITSGRSLSRRTAGTRGHSV